MKKLGFFILLVTNFTSFAQSTFQKSYGTTADEIPMSFVQTTDKGFALLSLPGFNNAYKLIKVDSLGNKVWSKEYGYNNPLSDVTNGSLIQTVDKGYLICDTHILIRIDSIGNVLWANHYAGSSGADLLNNAIEVPGGYIIAGTTLQNRAALLMKIDNSGNIQWSNESHGGDALNITQSKYDSCFYMIAVSDSAGGYTSIVKVDKNGNTKWSKYISIKGIPFIYINYYIYGIPQAQIIATPNSHTIAASVSNNDGINSWFTFDTSGTIINALSYPVTIGYFSWSFYTQSNQNNLLFAVGTNDTNSGTPYNHIALFKTDSSGNVKWAKKIGGIKTDYPADVIQTTDDGIGIYGGTQNFTYGTYSLYLIKTDSLGNSGCNMDTFHVNKLTPITVSLQNNPAISWVPNATSSIAVNVNSVINDSIYNDCNCHTPKVGFGFYASGKGSPCNSIDSSKWASHWYWSFGDGTYDSTDITPNHLYKDTGTYNVCLTVKNACGKDSLCKLIHYPDITIGINSITAPNDKISVYPNPGNGIFTVAITNYQLVINSAIEVYDVLGQKVYSQTLRQIPGDNTIDISSQPAGLYFYWVVSEKGEFIGSGKLLIQK